MTGIHTVAPSTICWATDRTDQEWSELAEGLRAYATECHHRAYESFQRSDTDGFLSQWASTSTVQEATLAAELADENRMWTFRALFNLGGKLVSTHQFQSRYGLAWVLQDAHLPESGKRFVNESKASTGDRRHAALLNKGYTIGQITARGRVRTDTSGWCQLSYYVAPIEERINDATVITTDGGPDSL